MIASRARPHKTQLSRLLLCIFCTLSLLLGSGLSFAAVDCSSLVSSEKITIKAQLGSGVESTHQTLSTKSALPIIWLRKVLDWAQYWDAPDISGDARWGYKLLLKGSKFFGFEKKLTPTEELYSIPTPEHANWAIDNFNAQMIKNKTPDEAIPLRLKFTRGIQSDLQFLSDYIRGIIPVAIDVSRTFLHDMKYHYLAAILMRPEIIKSWQRRAALVRKFVNAMGEKYPDDPIIQEHLPWVIKHLVGRIDQTGNVIPFLNAVRENKSDSLIFADLLKSHLSSPSDEIFIQNLAQAVAARVPQLAHYSQTNKISKAQELLIRQQYPGTHDSLVTRIHFVTNVVKTLQELRPTLDMKEHDRAVATMIISLNTFMETGDAKALNTWLRDFSKFSY